MVFSGFDFACTTTTTTTNNILMAYHLKDFLNSYTIRFITKRFLFKRKKESSCEPKIRKHYIL